MYLGLSVTYALVLATGALAVTSKRLDTRQQPFKSTAITTHAEPWAIAFLPDDIHSIHVHGHGDEPVWQLRYYERALDLQTDRLQFDADGRTALFAPNPNTPSAVTPAD